MTIDRSGELTRELARRIGSAQRLTIVTGAGVSAASGVPTFRGVDGLWRHHRPEDLATAAAFRRDPELVWEWYRWRRERIAACEPNAAHHAIARWSTYRGCRVITQNVDDLHVRAGTQQLVRLHGSIWELKCWAGCGTPQWRDEQVDESALRSQIPRCPSCGGLARPAVVWFGEPLADADLEAAVAACSCDVFVTVGTSALVYPAAGLLHRAAAQGAFTAEVNMDPTPATGHVDVAIQGAAEQLLPLLAIGG